MSGRPLAADQVWTFALEPAPPPIGVLTSTSNPFTTYLGEILRGRGLELRVGSASLISPAVLNFYDVIVLGEVALSAAQVTTLTNWVNAGGNLIAMRPDKQLAGAARPHATRRRRSTNAYLRVNNATEQGIGIVGETIQYHGTADRYTLNGAHGLATLYTNASTATVEPGGDAAVGRRERRSGGRVHLRPRPLDRPDPPGKPGLGRPGARRRPADPARTTSSTAPVPATSSPTGSTRRRWRSRRPTSSSACSPT